MNHNIANKEAHSKKYVQAVVKTNTVLPEQFEFQLHLIACISLLLYFNFLKMFLSYVK